MSALRVGLDVGGTKTDAVLVDGADAVLDAVRLPTERGREGVVRTILAAVDALSASGDATSVGIGIPGQVKPGSTLVAHALNLEVTQLDLAEALAPLLALPVRVENDVKAAALGAARLYPELASLALLNLGTGVAAGIVVEGRLWRGAGGSAGEVGHISIDPDGPLCRCGARGCIEAFAGGAALAERWGSDGPFPVAEIFDAADAGEPAALAARAGMARAVAAAVRVLVLTTDVEAVVLGGGLTALADRLVPEARAELERGAAASPFLRSLRLAERMRVLPAGSRAAALGAAIIGGERIEEARIHG